LQGGTIVALPCARQSNLLAGLAQAEALVEVPPNTTAQGQVFKARLLTRSYR
jgi:hypothetical protein